MSDTLLVSTRKGLFKVARRSRMWEITGAEALVRWEHANQELPGQCALLRLQLTDGVVGAQRLAGVGD